MSVGQIPYGQRAKQTQNSYVEQSKVYLQAGCDTLIYQIGRQLRPLFEI